MAMRKTVEGYVAMIDGYNRKVIAFNEHNNELIEQLENELPREKREFEFPDLWVERFYVKYGRMPK